MSEGSPAIIKIGEVADLLNMDIRNVRTLVDNGTIKPLPNESDTRLFSRKYIERIIEGRVERCPHCNKEI